MLIIVESPAKAKTIAKIVGEKYIVKASFGHIRKISNKKKNEQGEYLEINGININNNFEPIYEIDTAKLKIVKELQTLAQSAKDGILFATDEDREGEAISWHLAELLNIPLDKVKRMVFHEITQFAIEEAMKNPRPLNLSLVTAQQARQVLDKLVGYKLSPFLWQIIGDYHLSAGRVQSPTLRLLANREKAIQAHVPKEFWKIEANFVKLENLQESKLLKRIFDLEIVEQVLQNENLQDQDSINR